MGKLHYTLVLLIGLMSLFARSEGSAQTTVQAVSGLSSTNCIGTNALFLILLSPESLDVTPPSFVDNNPMDGITGMAQYNNFGMFGSAIFVSIQLISGTVGSTQTFTLTLEDAGGFTILAPPFPNGGITPTTATYIFSINVDGPPSVDILPSAPLLCNGSPANLTATVTNGASAVSYMWSANGGNSHFQGGVPPTSASATVLAEDTYNVTVTNACGSGLESTVVGAGVTPVVDLSCQDNGNNTTTITSHLLNSASNVTIRFYNDGNLQNTFAGLNGPTSVSEIVNSVTYLNQDFTVVASNNCGNSSNAMSCEILLPVELQYFKANRKDVSVMVEWSTLSEINNDYFTVEKSINGVDFMEATTIQGAGNSQVAHYYSYLDKEAMRTAAAGNTLYYRLKQTDFDGTHTYSDLVAVTLPSTGLLTINRLWQETNDLVVDFAIPSKSQVEGRIFSMEGRLIGIQKQEVEAGNVQLKFNTANLAPGMYLFSATDGERIISEKFIKL